MDLFSNKIWKKMEVFGRFRKKMYFCSIESLVHAHEFPIFFHRHPDQE